jgi:hypothetical protein
VDRSSSAALRQEYEEKRQQRELDRALKEQAKLSAIEQARLEVLAFENQLALLRSVHKQRSVFIDWQSLANSLPPHPPFRLARNRLASELRMGNSGDNPISQTAVGIESGQEDDQLEYEKALVVHNAAMAEWQRLKSLARRVLDGESHAYVEAIQNCAAFSEISNLGSSIHFTVHSRRLVECELRVNGREIIPGEIRSLSKSENLIVRPMPKIQFHEVYQDYVCSCVLRLAREIVALLPVETVLITAIVRDIDSQTGHTSDLPILSLAASSQTMESLNFEKLDPYDAISNFQHRGEVAVSRKVGAFLPIIPLAPAVFTPAQTADSSLDELIARCRERLSALSGATQKRTEQAIPSYEGSASII